MTPKIKFSIFACLGLFLFYSSELVAQVQVSEEPMHHKVLENKYIRLLDVWIQPGDTTQFHIHSTPSLFARLSAAAMSSQLMGKEWVTDQRKAGSVYYESFTPEPRIHRVTNVDTVPFHVNDVEILSAYNSAITSSPLPFTVLLENDKAYAYQITAETLSHPVHDRGPMIVEPVSGEGLVYHDIKTGEKKELKPGKFFYIEPASVFYFTSPNKEISGVLFEIR